MTPTPTIHMPSPERMVGIVFAAVALVTLGVVVKNEAKYWRRERDKERTGR